MNVERIVLRIERRTDGPPEETVRRNWGRPEMPSLEFLIALVESAYETIDPEWWVTRISLDVYAEEETEDELSAEATPPLDDPRKVAAELWAILAAKAQGLS